MFQLSSKWGLPAMGARIPPGCYISTVPQDLGRQLAPPKLSVWGVVTGTGREEGRLLLQRNCWENGKKINSGEKWEAGVFHPSGL